MIVVSVVFRGPLWLDGVAASVMEARKRNFNLKVSNLIKSSKQYSQLHVILISPRLTRNRQISIQSLARKVRLPVIAIKPYKRPKTRKRSVNNFEISVRGKQVAVMAAGVERDEAERLYRIGCSPYGTIPEAVRIADLLTGELNRK
jgi:endonuclease V-like protein UPF0215 family